MNHDSTTNKQYHGEITALPDLPLLEAEWRSLESKTLCSYFLSWSWIGTWLNLVQDKTNLQLYRCYCDGDLVALTIIASNAVKRRTFFRSRVLTLNEVSDKPWNMFIEYNGILAKQGHEYCAIAQLLTDIQSSAHHWDEMQLTNVPKECYVHLSEHHRHLQAQDEQAHTVWIAPLDSSVSVDSIIAHMSKNWRWKIRRTFKEYESEGPLSIDAAENLDDALNYFQHMGVLHTQRWQQIGLSGSFAQHNWVEFHQRLIRAAFERGEIQMLRIKCGARIIGYIYNFLWRDSVQMLQSGFVIEQKNILRPGYVSHILAMQLNAQRGAKQYDLMTGDSEYKRVLAEPHPPLISVRLQRPRLKFFVENTLVALYRSLRLRNVRKSDQHAKRLIAQSSPSLAIAVNLEPIFNLLSYGNVL